MAKPPSKNTAPQRQARNRCAGKRTVLEANIHMMKGRTMKEDALYRKGKKTRGEVLGPLREAAIVREEDEFSLPLRVFTTRYVWGEVWSRKGLPRKTRSLINVALLTAFKARQELKTHIR